MVRAFFGFFLRAFFDFFLDGKILDFWSFGEGGRFVIWAVGEEGRVKVLLFDCNGKLVDSHVMEEPVKPAKQKLFFSKIFYLMIFLPYDFFTL